MSRKIVAILLFLSLLFSYCPVTLLAMEIETESKGPVIQYVKGTDGDKICFEVVVKVGTSSTLYRTIGWTISVNGYKILYKYPEKADFDFIFYLKEIDREFQRQYGLESSVYQAVKKALYETGGVISFDAIHTVIKNGVVQGAIVENPIYGKQDSYNFIRRVYTDLSGIQMAENWSSSVKYKDLPKYFGISYRFSKQPSIQGRLTLEYQDTNGAAIRARHTYLNTFAANSSFTYAGTVPDLAGYHFQGWKLYDATQTMMQSSVSPEYTCTLNNRLPEANLIATYRQIELDSDLYIVSISPTVYQGDTKVVTVVTVGNRGEQDYPPDNPVSMRFRVNGLTFTRQVDLGRGKEVIVPFVWVTPSSGSVTLEAEINYDGKHRERDYTNNKLQQQVKIQPYSKMEIGETAKVPIVPRPGMKQISYREWQEWRFVKWDNNGKAVYEKKQFWVKLEVTADTAYSRMKSGYGFQLASITSVTTNYDRPEFIVPPQRVQVFIPETQFTKAIDMEIRSKPERFIMNWQFPENYRSVYRYRKHYIPIWFPDKLYYEMNVFATDLYCPGGMLSSGTSPKVYIDGNMYEDDRNGSVK